MKPQNDQGADIFNHIRGQIDEQKRGIYMHYAELKIKLPTYIKNFTLNELREAGATVSPSHIYIPPETEDRLRSHVDTTRKRANLVEKFMETYEMEKNSVLRYYKDVKRQLPEGMLTKKIGELDDTDWNCLGVDIIAFREKLEKTGRYNGNRH